MGIVVEDGQDTTGAEALIGLLGLAAQQQQQQPPPDVLTQIQQILQQRGQQNGQAPPPAPSAPQSVLPAALGGGVNGHAAPQYMRPTGDEGGHEPSAVITGEYAGKRTADRIANSDALAQFRAQQQDQRQAEREAHQQQLEQMRQADIANREQSHDLPQWIQQGITDGSLRYAPEQKRMMDEDQRAHVRTDDDPSLNPAQKAELHAKISAHDRQNRLNVQKTPPDEMPVTPQQQFEQRVVTYTDPDTGKKIAGFMGSRGGDSHFMPFKDDSDKIAAADAKAQAAQQKFEQQQEMHRQQMEQQAENHRQTLESEHAKVIAQLRKNKADNLNLKQSMLYNWQIANSKAKATDPKAADLPKPDLSHYDETDQRYEDMISELESRGSAVTPQLGAVDEGMQQSEGDFIQQQAPRDANGRVVVDSEEDGHRYGLPDGTPIVNSQGRTGTWHN